MAETFPVELNDELHKRLKITAIEEGLTLHDLVVKDVGRKGWLSERWQYLSETEGQQ